MVSRSALAVKKKPSSRNVLVRKSKVFQNRASIVPKDRGTNSELKRPSCATSSDLASSDWHEFTPQTINAQYCLARTWDDGYGGQCTRRALNDTATKLCASHKRASNHPLGLTHGLVTGAIPARKWLVETVIGYRQVRFFIGGGGCSCQLRRWVCPGFGHVSLNCSRSVRPVLISARQFLLCYSFVVWDGPMVAGKLF